MWLWLLSFFIILVKSQDPAPTWLGYAKGVHPYDNNSIITKIETYWKNPSNPLKLGCRWSIWFGIETTDNLNLIQPVNVWNNGSSEQWCIYNVYQQWVPSNGDIISYNHFTSANETIYGAITYNGNTKHSYNMYVTDLNDKWSINTTVPIQKDYNENYKSYQTVYVVFEHKCMECNQFSTDNQVTFYNISVFYDHQLTIPKWTTSYVTDACNNRAKILNDTAIQLTWKS